MQLNVVEHIISVQIPNVNNQVFRDTILKHSICNPRVILSPSSVCMVNGVRSMRFPNQYVKETGHDDSELYTTCTRRSPENGEEWAPWTYRRPYLSSQTRCIDNALVVLYRPKRTIMFHRHYKIRLCISRTFVTNYPFNFVFKKRDHILEKLLERDSGYDDCSPIQDPQYVSATKALRWLFHFEAMFQAPTFV